MPLSLHTAHRPGRPATSATRRSGSTCKNVPPSVFVNKDFQIRQALADMIFSGVFERLPAAADRHASSTSSAWIPFFLHQMDYTYTDRPPRGDWHRFKEPDALPSDFFRSQRVLQLPGGRASASGCAT